MHILSVLIPVYNEQAYLERLVDRVMGAWLPDGMEKELVIVNDASTDNTREVIDRLCAKFPNIKAFDQPKNAGKGAAIRRAIEEMTGDFAIIQDADLEYDPNEYHIVLKPLLAGHADVVYGSRFANREMRKVLFYHHKLGNYFITFLSNLTTGLDLTDMETCYKAFRGNILKSIPLRSNRFGIEPELTAKIAKRGLDVYEVPISYYGRKYSEGKKIGWKDGVSAIWTILKFWILDDYTKESEELQVQNSPDNTRRLLRTIVRRALPSLGDRILELESHVGLISRILPQRSRLVVSDSRTDCVRFLENLYDGNAVVHVRQLDPSSPDFSEHCGEEQFQSVVYVHQLSKVEDDEQVLKNISQLLCPDGKLVLVVPQHPQLMSSLDRKLGYRRRYKKSDLISLLSRSGYDVQTCYGINSPAWFAWLFFGKFLGRETLGKFSLKILNVFLPILGILPLPRANLFVVAKKKNAPPEKA